MNFVTGNQEIDGLLFSVLGLDPDRTRSVDIRYRHAETGELAEVDTGDPRVRARYAEALAQEKAVRQALLRRLAVDEVLVPLEIGYVDPLLRFFRARETRARRR